MVPCTGPGGFCCFRGAVGVPSTLQQQRGRNSAIGWGGASVRGLGLNRAVGILD